MITAPEFSTTNYPILACSNLQSTSCFWNLQAQYICFLVPPIIIDQSYYTPWWLTFSLLFSLALYNHCLPVGSLRRYKDLLLLLLLLLL